MLSLFLYTQLLFLSYFLILRFLFFFLLMLILPLSPQVLAYFYTVTDRQHSLVWYSFNLKFHKTCLDSKEIPTPYSSERIILDSSGLGSFCLQERRKVLCESEIMKESLNHPTQFHQITCRNSFHSFINSFFHSLLST